MIRIQRTAVSPAGLDQVAQVENPKNVALHAQGAITIKFPSKKYGSPLVRTALRESQYDKCCYCEKSTLDWPSDIEHFRPKGSIHINGRASKPGYFWLAYEWSNLLWACNTCNRSRKRSQFPLASELDRADPAIRSTAAEVPMLVNPLLEDPRAHVRFRDENPYSASGDRGKTSIKCFGLRRKELNELRRRKLAYLPYIVDALQTNRGFPEGDRAKNFLKEHVCDEAEFSSCVRDYLQARFGTSDPDQL